MHRFQLIHLSDLHVSTTPRILGIPDHKFQALFPLGTKAWTHPSSFDPDLFAAVVRYVYQNQQFYDAILISGDLATTGRKQDLDFAREHIEGPPDLALRHPLFTANGVPTLRGIPLPVMLLPGNHDRYDGAASVPGGRNFDSIFGAYWPPAAPGSCAEVHHLGTMTGPANERVIFIGADFCLRQARDAASFTGLWGQGFAYPDIVDALVTESDRQRRQQRRGKHEPEPNIVWVIHFAPTSNSYPANPDLALLNEGALEAAAKTAGVRQILCGHTHVPENGYPLGASLTTRVYCAGTATQYCAPAGNFIHRLVIDVDRAGTIAQFDCTPIRYDRHSKVFV